MNTKQIKKNTRRWVENKEEIGERKKDENEEGRKVTNKGDENDTYVMYAPSRWIRIYLRT